LIDAVTIELSHLGIKENFGTPLQKFVKDNVTAPLETADKMATSRAL